MAFLKPVSIFIKGTSIDTKNCVKNATKTPCDSVNIVLNGLEKYLTVSN